MTTASWRCNCEDGLRSAIDRVRSAIGDGSAPVIPVSEALHWIYATFEVERAGRDHLQAKHFLQISNVEIVLGLAYLRGKQIHQYVELAAEADLYPGAHTFPSDHLLLGRMWRWVSGIEKQWTGQLALDGRQLYRDHIAQQGVVVTLELATRALFGGA